MILQKKLLILLIVCFTKLYSFSSFASTIQLSGFVRDALTQEVLIGANVSVNNIGTSTDNHGYFSLKTNSSCTLNITYIGYKTLILPVNNLKDSIISIHLSPENSLKELTVTAFREKAYEMTRLSAKELIQTPSIGGKPDVIKTLQLLPGVLTQSEGMSLMMVRGGEPGQNQYLLDNVPLIYVNHLGGLMSVFNPDMINSVDFYKGNFPARLGGKLSSIVDISQRQGDISKHQGSFSLGVTDASFTLEGPLANNKLSYIITARKTLIDALVLGITTFADVNDVISSYGFHDINAKITWKPNVRDNLAINLYQGDDYLNSWSKPWKMDKNEKSHLNQQWGNWLISGRWNRVINTKIYAENILSFSRYRNKSGIQYSYNEQEKQITNETLNRASVNDFSFRSAWKYAVASGWKMEFGTHVGYLIYEPNFNYLSNTNTNIIGDIFKSFKSAVYLDNKFIIWQKLHFQPALRLTNFINNGENFFEFEPRINITCKFNEKLNINLNYMRVSQNSHLIFAHAEMLKREIWLPATSLLLPEISDQFSFSWNGSFANGKFSAESSFYFKKMQNLVTLKEGYENMTGLTSFENKTENNGIGVAYGTELMLRKNTGKWTGTLSYGWSYADRTYENINNGKTYEFDFNRPHSLALNIHRNLPKNWDLSVVWVFQSGRPYTPVLGKYLTPDLTTGEITTRLIVGEKNSDRMQAYHRLDIGFNHTITTKRGNKAVWTYSIYNVYNHINPFGYYYDNDNDLKNITYYNRSVKLYKMGLFSIIPSISYKVYFDYIKKPVFENIKKEKKKNNWLYFE
jgi:hypothetical protein